MKLASTIAVAAVILALSGRGGGVFPAALLCAAAGIAVGVQIGGSRLRPRPAVHAHDDRRISRAFVWFVGLVYAASWLLPAFDAHPREPSHLADSLPLMGWEAFSVAIYPLISTRDADGHAIQLLFWVLTALTNVIFLWATVRFYVHPAAPTGRWAIGLLCAAAVNTYWLLAPDFRVALLPGYYIWLTSFVLLAIVSWIRIDPSPSPSAAQSAA